MWDFMFIDNDSGEEFFVECDTLSEAWDIVNREFGPDNECEYEGRFTIQEAEWMGLDTY